MSISSFMEYLKSKSVNHVQWICNFEIEIWQWKAEYYMSTVGANAVIIQKDIREQYQINLNTKNRKTFLRAAIILPRLE